MCFAYVYRMENKVETFVPFNKRNSNLGWGDAGKNLVLSLYVKIK